MRNLITRVIGCVLTLTGMIFLQSIFDYRDEVTWEDIFVVLNISVALVALGALALLWNFKHYPVEDEE